MARASCTKFRWTEYFAHRKTAKPTPEPPGQFLFFVERIGIEPTTSCLKSRTGRALCYRP